jgi:hypothetical protein
MWICTPKFSAKRLGNWRRESAGAFGLEAKRGFHFLRKSRSKRIALYLSKKNGAGA